MKRIIKLIKHWDLITKILDSNEYYIATTRILGEDRGEHSMRRYEYFTNSTREIFFKFIERDAKDKVNNVKSLHEN